MIISKLQVKKGIKSKITFGVFLLFPGFRKVRFVSLSNVFNDLVLTIQGCCELSISIFNLPVFPESPTERKTKKT